MCQWKLGEVLRETASTGESWPRRWVVSLFFQRRRLFFLVSKLCHEKWTLLWFVIFLKLIETLVLVVYKRLKVCAIDFGLRGLGFTPGRVISVPCRGGRGWVGERNRDKLRLERPLAKPSLFFLNEEGKEKGWGWGWGSCARYTHKNRINISHITYHIS